MHMAIFRICLKKMQLDDFLHQCSYKHWHTRATIFMQKLTSYFFFRKKKSLLLVVKSLPWIQLKKKTVWTNSTLLHNETWIRQEVAQMRRHDSTFLWLLNFNDWQRFPTVKTVHAARMIKPAKKQKRETASMNNCLHWGVSCVASHTPHDW